MKTLLKVVAGLLLLLLAAVTNPTRERHQEALREAFGREHKVAGALGVGYLYSGLSDYRDYVFFSVTRYEGELRSVGVCGYVWVR